MKKLLSLLSMLTITGTTAPSVIAASSYQKQETKLENNEINYLQTNNLENLTRNKRDVNNQNKISGITKIIFRTKVCIESSGVVLNNKLYFGSNDGKVYEYDPATSTAKVVIETRDPVQSSGVVLNNKLYFGSYDHKVYEYDPATSQQKVVIETAGWVRSSGVVLNNKLYFGSYDHKVYEYDPATSQQKVVIETAGWVRSSGVVLNNKLYFGSRDKNFYEYDPATSTAKVVMKTGGWIRSSGVVLNNKLYFGSYDGKVYEYNPVTNTHKIVISTLVPVDSSGVVLKNKVYFGAANENIYEYDPATSTAKVVMKTGGWIRSSGVVLNNKLYFGSYDHKVYEYDPATSQQKVVIETAGPVITSGVVLNNKLYFGSNDHKVYEYEPLKLIESDIIDLQEQIRRGLYLYYQEKNPNSYVKNIEFNMNDLKYSDIELIEQEKNPSDIITNTIYQNDNETFTNTFTEDTIFKTIAHKYTEEIIESIQLIKGINKRIDNTIEEGTSETNTNSKVNTHSTTWSVGIKTELSAGWGPVTANISSSVTNEESNTLQIENSNSQTKNISKIISKSDSYDLSNIKEESKKTIHETEIQSQSFPVRPNQRIIVKTKVNKIIKKYKVTFKQKIAGKIKAKIKNEYDQITEQEFSIKDIILSLKENNLLPQEIILDNNNVFFKSTVLVGKTSFNSNTEPNWFDLD